MYRGFIKQDPDDGSLKFKRELDRWDSGYTEIVFVLVKEFPADTVHKDLYSDPQWLGRYGA
jgi:hypothetical protein